MAKPNMLNGEIMALKAEIETLRGHMHASEYLAATVKLYLTGAGDKSNLTEALETWITHWPKSETNG